MEYAAEYFTGEICDGLSIIGLLCIIPFPIAEEVGVQSWSWRVEGPGVRGQELEGGGGEFCILTQRGRGAEVSR